MAYSPPEIRDPGQSGPRIDLRLLIATGALLGLALSFWFGSRYPALNEKALMGGDAPMSGLAFDILLDIFPDSPLWWQFIANTLNWIYTNIKGMTFGVLFGAALITLLSLIRRKSFESGFANAALGTAIGAPLGVCVNCAAPIAFGLHLGRMRLETTLSALIASPTLNVIVVTMSFSLLPVHMAATKLVLALAMVLLVVPLLCKYVLVAETELTKTASGGLARLTQSRGLTAWIGKALAPADAGSAPRSVAAALLWFLRAYGRNLFFIGIVTVPMMILAGMLGALIAMGFNSATLFEALPRAGALAIILTMLAIALIASIAPAPIALDVILTIVLMSVGMTSQYATVLLIALGSYSVYAFFILWRAVSPRTALSIWIATLAMAMLGGVIAKETRAFEERYYKASTAEFLDGRAGFDLPRIAELPPAPPLEALRPVINAQRQPSQRLEASARSSAGHQLTLARHPMDAPRTLSAGKDTPVFARLPGATLGFEDIGISTPLHEFAPGMMLGGIAAGDIHNDGWVDVVVRRPTGAKGLSLYANTGGRFQRQALDLGPVAALEVASVAFADLDNDGWLDLVVSTFWDGLFVFQNSGGDFASGKMLRIPAAPLSFAHALAFADMDNNGFVDILVGAYASGQGFESWLHARPASTVNVILWNHGGSRFTEQPLAGAPGQTLTSLIADFNADGRPDLLKGDDVAGTDQVVFFGDDGSTHTAREMQPFPYSMRTTMSFDEGDWNNDLIPDFYGGQISERGGSDVREATRGDGRVLLICQQLAEDLGWSADQLRSCASEMLSVDSIRGLRSGLKSNPCTSQLMSERDATSCGIARFLATLREDVWVRKTLSAVAAREKCETVLAPWPFTKRFCETFTVPVFERLTAQEQKEGFMPYISSGNILMTGDGNGSYTDHAPAQNVAFPGWTWNSRFTDLDQDGWQDLLVLTGIWLAPSRSTTNVFYRNEGGRFTDLTRPFGFYDLTPSFSYALVDFDRDGDVDVIRPPDGRAAVVHRNDRPAGPALWVHLRDEIGNRMGVGARVTICTDGQRQVAVGKCQTRPIKASGGFMSFDPIAAHFGLGSAASVDLIEIVWRDGNVSRIIPSALKGGEITITRRRALSSQ